MDTLGLTSARDIWNAFRSLPLLKTIILLTLMVSISFIQGYVLMSEDRGLAPAVSSATSSPSRLTPTPPLILSSDPLYPEDLPDWRGAPRALTVPSADS